MMWILLGFIVLGIVELIEFVVLYWLADTLLQMERF